MSDEVDHDRHHGLLRSVAQRITEHHKHDEDRPPEEDFAEVEEEVGFDLDTDVAQPLPHSDAEAFDLDRDINYGNEPPQLRS
jgi:hypothetical protein